jgi:Lipase (class 3)
MSYPLIPSVFLMDVASNGASSIIDTQPNLLKYLQVYLNGGTNPGNYKYAGFFNLMNPNLAGGDWSVVWGPCVYVRSGDVTATNAMYVAHSPSQATYIVCIAATNPISIFDWVVEDAGVDPHYAAPWPPKLPFQPKKRQTPIPTTTPAISAGTAVGISDLLTQKEMIDPTSGQDLQTFLQAKADSNTTLIVGGHSLAGALSPTLAYYLQTTATAGTWKQVLVLPSAGATPGNQAYAQGFNAAFAQSTDPTSGLPWNTDYANHHDVVPHAWDKLDQVVFGLDLDGNFLSIWGKLKGGGLKSVGSLVAGALFGAMALAGGYYTAIRQRWVTPKWGYWDWTSGKYPPVWMPLPVYTDQNPLTTLERLGQTIDATHIDQYFNFFGVVPAPKMQVPKLMVSKEAVAASGNLVEPV